jgi:hypothetical protein
MPDLSQRLYALPDCSIQPIDSRSIMLIRLDTGAVALVDARWRGFLHHLRRFRTLKDHVARLVREIPELRGHEQGLEQGFAQLVPRGIFYSADEVIAQIDASRARTPAEQKPLTLCIRTCDRPDFLRRLLNSLVDNAKTFGGCWPIEILDDSKTIESQHANQALSREFASDLTLTYVGQEEQEKMIKRLCHQAPEDCESLRWLMDAQHPANQHQATYGRLYNLAFMRHAGKRILLIDDDTVLRAWQQRNRQKQPRLQLLSTSSDTFTAPEKAYAALESFNTDPIAAHANILGLPIAAALEQITEQPFSAEMIAGLDIASVPHPYAHLERIRYTHNGFLGDTGTTSDHHYFLRLRLTAPEMLLDNEQYQHFRQSPRCAFSGANAPELLSGTHFHHTTCAGIDLSGTMLPVLPKGRSEDALLGAFLRLLYPGDYGLRHPFALEHRLHNAKPWNFAVDDIISQSMDTSTALSLWANLLAAPAEVTPEQRSQLLCDSILTADDKGILRDRLRAMLERHLAESLAFQFAVTRSELGAAQVPTPEGVRDIPTASLWRQELAAFSQWLAKSLHKTDTCFTTDEPIEWMSKEIRTFANAMPAWQRAYRSL